MIGYALLDFDDEYGLNTVGIPAPGTPIWLPGGLAHFSTSCRARGQPAHPSGASSSGCYSRVKALDDEQAQARSPRLHPPGPAT